MPLKLTSNILAEGEKLAYFLCIPRRPLSNHSRHFGVIVGQAQGVLPNLHNEWHNDSLAPRLLNEAITNRFFWWQGALRAAPRALISRRFVGADLPLNDVVSRFLHQFRLSFLRLSLGCQ